MAACQYQDPNDQLLDGKPMNDTEKPDQPELGAALSRSIGGDGIELIVTSADIMVDTVISSGTLDGIPVVGLLTKGLKSAKEIRDELYLRKIVKFLQELNAVTKAERDTFVRDLEKDGKTERFGETMLLILDRMGDSSKPAIAGRILAAHISGKISSYTQAMRLVAIVNRVYAEDIAYLSSFRSGLQSDEDIAASLFASGLLANTGFDGGGADQNINPGGYTYDLNEYGRLLIAHGME